MQETAVGAATRPRDTSSIDQRRAARRRAQRLRALAIWSAVAFGAAWIIVFGASVILG